MPQQYTYRPNMNRNVTRKWAEARQVDYDGDDWGADPYGGDDYEPVQQPISQGGRSFTNPAALNTSHRLSFDQGQEHRVFSAGAAGSHSGFPPTTQHGFSQALPSQPQYSQGILSSRAPEPAGRTSTDSSRRAAQLSNLDSTPSDTRAFPPRKSSLSQNDPPPFLAAQPAQPSPQAEEKPLPFIRPADIYKRMDQEREKERLSQESSRPSLDSVQRADAERAGSQEDPQRRMRTDLDTVPERKSEYGMESLLGTSGTLQTTGRDVDPQQGTQPLQKTFSGMDTTPIDSMIAAESTEHASRSTQRPGLPELGRMSTFGPDFFSSNTAATGSSTSGQPTQSTQGPSGPNPAGQNSSQPPYRTFVDTAFQSEHGRRGSPSVTDDSLLRSDTTSTSQISPIVSRHAASGLTQGSSRDQERHDGVGPGSSTAETVEDLGTPRRLGTNRRDSPSPARRPTSMVAPTISEPQSAVLSPSDQELSRDTATEAQILRPGPAILIHQKATSSESVPKAGKADAASEVAASSVLRNQQSHLSERSDLSDQRTTSDEWRDWSNQRKEFNARHGFKDSNPTTPGVESGMLGSAPSLDSFDRNLSAGAARTSHDSEKPLPAVPGQLDSSRPQMFRDESFRPQLPGGWESSASVQRAAPTGAVTANQSQSQPPALATRSESAESIPTAGAPREANWRSQYTGPQAQAFAAAQAAGKAMAGIFNGPALTGGGGDSEVSSINDHEHPEGRNRDSSLFVRDFGSTTSHPPIPPDESATRDFASVSSPQRERSETTPKASQQPFAAERASTKSTSSNRRRQLIIGGIRAPSPSRDSEKNWWSDDEDDAERGAHADAPAPLRTNRLSTVESQDRKSPSLRHNPRVDSEFQDQLESDIVKSLTPKSSNIETTGLGSAPRLSPTRTNQGRAGSPPFAAAALALSPGRTHHALQEQNTFHPLSDPETPTSQTPSGVLLPGAGALGTSTSGAAAPAVHRPALSMGGNRTNTILPSNVDAADVNDRQGLPSTDQNSLAGDDHATSSSHAAEKALLPPAAVVGAGMLAHERASELSKLATSQEGEDLSSTDTVKASVFGGPVQPPSGSEGITSDNVAAPSTPQKTVHQLTSISSSNVASADHASRDASYDPNRPFPSDKVPIEKIFGMGSAQERIQAYNDNREAYAQPVGHLENWLSHMNTAEHADVFTAAPRARTEHGTPNSRHRREDSTPSGTKQMQEDGKKLLASASKYGAKAGVLGKGLLSKGKEKLRTVSASQKGGTTNQRNVERIDAEKTVPASESGAPQLPTPVSSTPLGESSFSAYFPPKEQTQTAPHISGAAVAPPFSPISEVSSSQNELGRSFSAVSEDRSMSTPKQTGRLGSTGLAAGVSRADSKRRSTGGLGAVESDHLNPNGGTHHRTNSSVSDVSSVSDTLERRRSHAARTISPPIEHQVSRDDSHSVSPMPIVQNVADRHEAQRYQHAPSYSTAMASKEEEAARDRVEEQPLPEYQSGRPKPSKIAPGTQIVPIARLRQDHEVRAEEPRPFSFVGSESLLHTGHGTNQSIDNPGVDIGAENRGQFGQPGEAIRGQAGGAVPHDNNEVDDPDEPHQQSRILTQDQAEEQYRIPGPYGHELRSPRPKGSSPMAENFRSPTVTQPPADAFGSTSKASRAVTSEYTPFPPQVHPQHQGQQQPLPAASMVDSRLGMAHYTPSRGDRYDGDSDYTDERDYDQSRDRGRASKFTALFKSRSKSRSRRLQKEASREQRPDNNRRSSLFKFGGRNSMQREEPYNEPVHQVRDERPANYAGQSALKPGAGNRQSDNNLMSGAPFEESEYVSPIQHGFATSHKRKRFSGLFGKSQTQIPTRASTLPSQPQQPPLPDQVSGVHRSNEPQSAMAAPRHVTFDQTRDSPLFITPSQQLSGFHDQATVPRDTDDVARQRRESYRQSSNDGIMAQTGSPRPEDRYGPSRQDTGDSEPYNNWLLAQDGKGGHPDQYSQHTNASGARGLQPGSLYQHENRPYAYDNTNQHAHENSRPVLPRLNTGENHASGAAPFLASAPAVADSYLQSRQNGHMGRGHTNTMPHMQSDQQNQQISFPQPPPLSHYNQSTSGHDYNNNQMASPLPISPGFSDSNTLVQSLPGAFHSMPGHYHGRDNVSQPAATYPQQPVSRISPHVAQLHVRSRSPKLGRRGSDELNHEFETANNNLAVNAPQSGSSRSPVAGLGTFNNKKVSPIGGIPRSAEEQEKPWAITLPVDEEESRRLAEDPESSTSTKAREMRRMMLERSPIAGSESSTTTGGPVQEPGTLAPRTAIISPPVDIGTTQPHERETGVDVLPTTMTEPQRHENEPIVPPRPNNKPSLLDEHTTPVSVQPGTQRVAPPVRKTTPITIGRPTTPSFMLRRDASLRGKGPRNSTSIDEAGRTMVVTGLANRSATPTSMAGANSRSTSVDISRRSRSSSWNSKDVAQQQHDATIPGRANTTVATATPGSIGESGSPVPPVPSIPASQQGRVVSGGSIPDHSHASAEEPIIPTTTNTLTGPINTDKSLPLAPNDRVTGIHESNTSNANTTASPAKPSLAVYEMMGSRPDGYESDDEPMMSATAYPGQEWQPVFDRWED